MAKIDIEGLAQKMIDAVRGYVAREGAALGKRVGDIDARIAELEAKVEASATLAARAESLERRASRHAEHLARLESRVQTLEH